MIDVLSEFTAMLDHLHHKANKQCQYSYTNGYHGMYFLVEKKGMEDVKTTLKKGANYANSMKL